MNIKSIIIIDILNNLFFNLQNMKTNTDLLKELIHFTEDGNCVLNYKKEKMLFTYEDMNNILKDLALLNI